MKTKKMGCYGIMSGLADLPKFGQQMIFSQRQFNLL